VGLGHNGLAHVSEHISLAQSEVIAVCDRSPERLAAAGEQFGITRLYSGDEIYADPDIDAISIHTGDNDHREPFVKALDAGKHVFIEKPVANTEEDMAAMLSACRNAGPVLKVQVGYILRFDPVYESIHSMAAAGQLGDIYYMEADYIHNLLYQAEQTDPATGRNWYLEEEVPIVGGGSHCLDLLRWFSGKEVAEVTGYSTSVAFPAMRNDDCQVALFRFADGSIAKVAALYAPRCHMAPYYNLRLYGEKGTVDRDQIALSEDAADIEPDFKPVDSGRVEGHPYTSEIIDWLDAIVCDRPPRTDFCDGANSTLATLCAARALSEKRTIQVPTSDDL